jgi:hypothetical protein
MAERNFVVLRYEGKVPAMSGCEKCKRKFFTPALMLVTPLAHRNTCLASLIITIVNRPLSPALSADSKVSVCPTQLFEWRRLGCCVQMTAKTELSPPKRRTRAEAQRLVAEFVGSGMRRSEFCESRGLSFSHAGSPSEKTLCTQVTQRHFGPREAACRLESL